MVNNYGQGHVEDHVRDQIVLDAIELLRDGYPIDDETKQNLERVGIKYADFIREFEIPT